MSTAPAIDNIDIEFATLRDKVSSGWYAKLLPLVRERYPGASTKEIDAATIEACLFKIQKVARQTRSFKAIQYTWKPRQ